MVRKQKRLPPVEREWEERVVLVFSIGKLLADGVPVTNAVGAGRSSPCQGFGDGAPEKASGHKETLPGNGECLER